LAETLQGWQREIKTRKGYSCSHNEFIYDMQDSCPDGVPVLVGNTGGSHYEGEIPRTVSYEEASHFAQEHGIAYIETNAKTGKNVNELFQLVADKLAAQQLAYEASQLSG
jgi:GTPase SAR1 family protein